MRSVFIGTVEFSRACLEHLIAMGMNPVGIVTRSSSNFNADYADLIPVATAAGIPVLHTTNINEDTSIGWIEDKSPDVVLCCGWSQILSPRILKAAPLGVIGYHPALLPRNRGRHPIIWALVLGLHETGSTFFFMDEFADSGDILSQIKVNIEPNDDAGSLYSKLTDAAVSQLSDFMPKLETGDYVRTPQSEQEASNWRKRTMLDGRIDWRMSTDSIHNLIRALSRPYPGATVVRAEKDQIVWQSEKSNIANAVDIEPGLVIGKTGSTVDVKTGDGVITLINHELAPVPEVGEYL